MARQQIIFTNDVAEALTDILQKADANKTFILTDRNTCKLEQPLPENAGTSRICIRPGDTNKNIAALQEVWTSLGQGGGTRKSVLVNFGGGVVTDLGGFAAATFKRGIRFINIPTTLLAAVDAAVGGKTGINFNGLKNEIGAFREAEAVIISTRYFGSLPAAEIKSGYAEMLKHGMLCGNGAFRKLLGFDFRDAAGSNLLAMLEESVEVKRRIVEEDPLERGLRRALNLGHTAGHAFESLSLQRGTPIPHGFAVAWGLVVEAVLSHTEKGLPSNVLYDLAGYVRTHYGAYPVSCDDYPALLQFMRHDKKSENGEYNFSLLRNVGAPVIDCHVEERNVCAALDIFRDLMHI